jgi:hypothetical protein
MLLDTCQPYIPGDVGNAATYNFPVRFQKVPGLTVERIFNHDLTLKEAVYEAAVELKKNGVSAVTGDCGFLIIYQRYLANRLGLPVFLSSLLQISFMQHLIPDDGKIGIITASAKALDDSVLRLCCSDDLMGRLAIQGLENSPHFAAAFLKAKTPEDIRFEYEKVEEEVVAAALNLVEEDPKVNLLLLECSVLPPYGDAVQRATGLPVFDFVTMINYVYGAMVKQRFDRFDGGNILKSWW